MEKVGQLVTRIFQPRKDYSRGSCNYIIIIIIIILEVHCSCHPAIMRQRLSVGVTGIVKGRILTNERIVAWFDSITGLVEITSPDLG